MNQSNSSHACSYYYSRFQIGSLSTSKLASGHVKGIMTDLKNNANTSTASNIINTKAIPTIQVTNTALGTSSPDRNRKRASSSSRIEQIRSSSSRVADKVRDKFAEMEGKKVENPAGMQDRLMNM